MKACIEVLANLQKTALVVGGIREAPMITTRARCTYCLNLDLHAGLACPSFQNPYDSTRSLLSIFLRCIPLPRIHADPFGVALIQVYQVPAQTGKHVPEGRRRDLEQHPRAHVGVPKSRALVKTQV